jgi:F-type H+-transporting ATPase subunit a
MRRGCSVKILVPVIILAALLVFSFLFGPLGNIMFNIKGPDFLQVTKPHVVLPSEGIIHLSFFTITNTLLASWLTILVLVIGFYFCTRKMKLVPGRAQAFAEFIVESLLNFIEGSAGKKNSRVLFPLVATIFLYVITNAYLALLPFFGTIGIEEGEHAISPFLRAANTDINLPLSIALVSFVAVEYWGLKSIGILHYINSFFNFGQYAKVSPTSLKEKSNLQYQV